MEPTQKTEEPSPTSGLPEPPLTAPSQSSGPEKPKTAGNKGLNFMLTMKQRMWGIKRVVVDQWIRHSCDGDSEKTRAYHFWPAKNLFFFRGRLVCGPDPRGLVFTTLSIIVSTWILIAYVVDHSTLIITFALILAVTVLVSLFLVSSIDPGIIPRHDDHGCDELMSEGRRRVVCVNGVEEKLKYCRVCKIYRPPRSCHCAVCDNCVQRFDHHCPWIGQCIALRNYRFYLMFVVSALAFFAYVSSVSCWRINLIMSQKGTGILGIVEDCPETLALASFSFSAGGFLCALMFFHVYLISTNQTSYENFRQRFVGSTNPYNKGVLRNFKDVLFVPLPSSQVDFRAEVLPRWYINPVRGG